MEKKKRMEAEERKKFPLEKRFSHVIVGQDGAINAVASGLYLFPVEFFPNLLSLNHYVLLFLHNLLKDMSVFAFF